MHSRALRCLARAMGTIATCAFATANAAPQRGDTTAAKRQLLEADSALGDAIAQQGASVFFDAVAPDGAVLIPGQPILRGRREAANPFAARYGGGAYYRWRPLHAVSSADGQFGCTVGVSRYEVAGSETGTARHGMYLTCWLRGSGGRWRITAHQRNDSPAVAPSRTDDEIKRIAPHSARYGWRENRVTEAYLADSTFAAMSADGGAPGLAFGAFAEADGLLLTPPTLPRGPARIQNAVTSFPRDRELAWTPSRLFGAGGRGLAFVVGNSIERQRSGQGGPEIHGKYRTVWRERGDSWWEYVLDLRTPRP